MPCKQSLSVKRADVERDDLIFYGLSENRSKNFDAWMHLESHTALVSSDLATRGCVFYEHILHCHAVNSIFKASRPLTHCL